MKKRNSLIIALILIGGLLLAWWVLSSDKPALGGDEHGEVDGQASYARGPHGGRWFEEGGFAVEVTIYEEGVPPEFRVYTYLNKKPLNPAQVQLQVTVHRLGVEAEQVNFKAQGDYLLGDRELVEPHSFSIDAKAEYQGRSYQWHYDQVEGRVYMDDAAASKAGVTIETAGPVRIHSVLQRPGEIQFNQSRVAHVVPRISGVIRKTFHNVGDTVRKGDVLVVLESHELADLYKDHESATKRLELARQTFNREKQLWEEKISAEQDYLASRLVLAEAEIVHHGIEHKLRLLGLTKLHRPDIDVVRYEIRSPIDGVITESHLGMGEAVTEDTQICTVADLSTVWAEMTVYPKDLEIIRVGQPVTVRATAFGEVAEGVIASVGSLMGEQTRSAKARILLKNPEGRWRPGLFVSVDVLHEAAEVPVAVRIDAIQSFRDEPAVFGRFGNEFEVRPVQLGRKDGQWVEVVSGLPAGARYASTNSFVLKADVGKAGASHDH